MVNASTQATSSADVERAHLVRMFEDMRRRLVETGTRNRLIHVNRNNIRGHVVNIVHARPDDVYRTLCTRSMRFLPIGLDKVADEDGVWLGETPDPNLSETRGPEQYLECRLGPDALQKKLLKIAREAQTAEEESGVNILYLALGVLTWFEDKKSDVRREAPLVLLPVELVRNPRTSAHDIRVRDEDIVSNLPLQQRLKEDFGIDLPEVDVDDDWAPSLYYAEVRRAIGSRDGWTVEPDAIQLGFFSFSKLLMYRDLDVATWPDQALADHALTRALLYEGFAAEPPLFARDERLDDHLPPDRLFHVVDADSSQAKVIEEVRAGRNLVVQGPPGTGKSQTITNIIAAAVKEGKRVLFVAEKMAALSVVHERLVKVGLRDICLELHSRTANKKAVLGELSHTIAAAAAIPPVPEPPHALAAARDRLNAIADALHAPIGATGETPYSVLGRQSHLIGAGAPPPTLSASALATMTRQQETRLCQALQEYGQMLAAEPSGEAHPFEGVRNIEIQPVELARLAASLVEAAELLPPLAACIEEICHILGASAPPSLAAAGRLDILLSRVGGLAPGSVDLARLMLAAPDVSRLREALGAAAHWRRLRDEESAVFVDSAFDLSVAALRAPLFAGSQSFFARWGGAYRRASRELAAMVRAPLPRSAAKRVALVDDLHAVGAARSAWIADEPYCARVMGDYWRGDRTDFLQLLGIAAWCEALVSAPLVPDHEAVLRLASTPSAADELRHRLKDVAPAARDKIAAAAQWLDLDPASLGTGEVVEEDVIALARRFVSMANATDRYAGWARQSRLRLGLTAAGLQSLAEHLQARRLDGAAAATELRYARAEHLWRTALDGSPLLRELAAEQRHDLVARFAELERNLLRDNVTAILADHLGQVPLGAQGEMGVVRGEIGKKTRHLAIRRLFERAGNAIQRIKPVLLMSPISVAQYLPPGSLTFDLLVLDEASQVRPEDALGAIARARQIVVVGDQKQLPPSSFFDRLATEDEGEDEDDPLDGAARAGEMESILSLCEARGLGGRMLSWHYRSRVPSLIEVSNRAFYKGGLILPPSPLQGDPAYGLCLTRVQGAYDRGGRRDNRLEGQAVVERVAEHARTHPTLSLGIVTFSSAQRNRITELIEHARRHDPALDAFLREGQAEDLFVKNIENVQGDERDVILISVGYGPTVPGGRLASMSFGPVNAEGGERRLNVLFTRARIRCEIFISFDPADMDVGRTSGEGPRILKQFLDFAATGRLTTVCAGSAEADSPFEEDVADAIRSLGYIADPQVGTAGFRIDLGVRDPASPGTYLLAVECDGATYHGALWARERDRLRQDVLEHLGWRFHRIWSTDWFYDRPGEIERLRTALGLAVARASDAAAVTGANRERPASEHLIIDRDMISIIPDAVQRKLPLYAKADCRADMSIEPHRAGADVLADLARRIVAVEGPVHEDEVARRIAAAFGKEKAGSRIMSITREALALASTGGEVLICDPGFWCTPQQLAAPPVRDRSAEIGNLLKPSNISPLELRAALDMARTDMGGGGGAELIRYAARLLGFRRVGPELQQRFVSMLT